MEISEYDEVDKQPSSGWDRDNFRCITEITTSLSWFSSFNPKVIASGIKYYRNVVKTSCELMREKFNRKYIQ